MDEYGQRIPSQTDEWRKTPGKKNTKRWRKGHIGREHKPEIQLQRWPFAKRQQCHPAEPPKSSTDFLWGHDQHGFVCYHEVVCSVCNKRLEFTPERCPLNTEA